MVGAVSYRATPVTTVCLRGAGGQRPRYGKRGYPNWCSYSYQRRLWKGRPTRGLRSESPGSTRGVPSFLSPPQPVGPCAQPLRKPYPLRQL